MLKIASYSLPAPLTTGHFLQTSAETEQISGDTNSLWLSFCIWPWKVNI